MCLSHNFFATEPALDPHVNRERFRAEWLE